MGISKSVDSYESGPSLASRICKIERQVDNLDLKVDKLCQLANNLLEHNIRQQASIPAPSSIPIAPIVINRMRAGSHFHLFRRRHRRRMRSQAAIPTFSLSSQPPTPGLTSSTRSSSHTNLTQPSVPPPSPTRNHSHESLVSLYWLFQDNTNSTRTYVV